MEQAMLENNKIYEKIVYPNADHAFHNDTGPHYNPEAAKDAWEKGLPGSNSMCAMSKNLRLF